MEYGFISSVVLSIVLAVAGSAAGQEDRRSEAQKHGTTDDPFTRHFPTANERVEALLAVIREAQLKPNPNADENDRRIERALQTIAAMGKPAVPRLLDKIGGPDYDWCQVILIKMGKPAVDEVRARWPKMSHEVRWRLMDFRGQHDYEQAADYALGCLTVDFLELRSKAWNFLLDHKEKRVKEEFFRNLRGESKFPPHMYVIRNDPVFDSEKEIDLLIALLDPDSWAARDVGEPHTPRTLRYRPEDQREFVIYALTARKAKRAAPALLALLAERGPGRAYFGALIIPLLGEYGHKEAAPELKRILETDGKQFAYCRINFSPERVKMMAARSLLQLGDKRGREYLLPFLDSKNIGDREFASVSFALGGDKSDIHIVAKLLRDSNGDVRKEACAGLARITGVDIHAQYPDWPREAEDTVPWLKWYEKEYGKKP